MDSKSIYPIEKDAAVVNRNNSNLKPFKDAGGKFIIVSSWNSLALPPHQVYEYYKSVEKNMGGPRQTQDFDRLFSIPVTGGCVVGENFKAFEALQEWVEEGKAPDKIVVAMQSRVEGEKFFAHGRYASIP